MLLDILKMRALLHLHTKLDFIDYLFPICFSDWQTRKAVHLRLKWLNFLSSIQTTFSDVTIQEGKSLE